MNKRQSKKRYKKKYGYNPPSKKQMMQDKDHWQEAIDIITELINQTFEKIKKIMEEIETMTEKSEEEAHEKNNCNNKR